MPQREVATPAAELAVHPQRGSICVTQIQSRPRNLAGGVWKVRGQPNQPPAGQRVDVARTQRREPQPSRGDVGRQRDPVVRRQRIHRGHPTLRVDRKCRAGDAGQDRRRHRPEPVQGAVVLLTQMGLGEPSHRVDQRDGRGMHRRRRARHVHHTDDVAGPRVLDGCTGTGPGVVAAGVVLGGEHLHGTVGHQGRADGVGTHCVLAPMRAFDEAEPVGLSEDGPRPGPPQHPPLRIGDHQDVVALGHQRSQAAGDLVEHSHQAGGLPQHVERAVLHLRSGQRVRARCRAPSIDARSPR